MNQSGGAHCRGRKALTYRRRNYEPPQSPFLHWKFDNEKTTGGVVQASARKLAAGLWQLRFSEISWGRKIKFNSCPSDPSPPQPQIESSLATTKCASEKATKWDRGCSGESDDIYQFYSHMKLLEDCQVTTSSMASALNAELAEARLCIRELQAKRKSFKMKVKHFLRKLEEERISWQTRAHWNNHAIKDLKEELGRERKHRQQMENVNTNLINQLAGVKVSVEQFMKKYEEEKKNRKFMEEVSGELAAQIGEDKAEAEALKRESIRILEEAEEERKMFHLAAVWREERVQMKLIDAKLALEDKYCQLNKLITDVETFLRSKFGTLDMAELRKAELILQEVKSLNVTDTGEFSYLPPNSDEIYSDCKDLQQCEGNDREIEPYVCRSPSSHNSTVHPMNPEDNGFNKTSFPMQLNCFSDYDSCYGDAGLDNMSHAEDHQGSCDSLVARNTNVNKVGQAKNVSRRSEHNTNVGQYSPDREISEVCSPSEKQSKQEASPTSKISCPSNGEFHKIVLDEGERRLSNGITSRQGTKAYRGLFQQRVEQWIPTDIANPHITRGMRGSIEWPRTIQTNCSKAKLLEAKIESQKSQLRHVLKQKIR
ncbi:hypothetical protein ACFX2I_036907 [Malus domestica]|uniref:uncharacterized protein n=1 Tax=Malus domestica TaxID=3750 RepID=UPI000498757C|nr:uncharacterized protein LOC103434504 [Malus domestica]